MILPLQVIECHYCWAGFLIAFISSDVYFCLGCMFFLFRIDTLLIVHPKIVYKNREIPVPMNQKQHIFVICLCFFKKKKLFICLLFRNVDTYAHKVVTLTTVHCSVYGCTILTLIESILFIFNLMQMMKSQRQMNCGIFSFDHFWHFCCILFHMFIFSTLNMFSFRVFLVCSVGTIDLHRIWI